MLRKHYQPGDAAREAEMFPSNRAFAQPGEMDPGRAWCVSARAVDPDYEIALALARRLRAEREKDAKSAD